MEAGRSIDTVAPGWLFFVFFSTVQQYLWSFLRFSASKTAAVAQKYCIDTYDQRKIRPANKNQNGNRRNDNQKKTSVVNLYTLVRRSGVLCTQHSAHHCTKIESESFQILTVQIYFLPFGHFYVHLLLWFVRCWS